MAFLGNERERLIAESGGGVGGKGRCGESISEKGGHLGIFLVAVKTGNLAHQ